MSKRIAVNFKIWFTLALVTFGGLTWAVVQRWGPLLHLDQGIRDVVNAHRTPELTACCTHLTHLYDQTGTIIIATTIVLACFLGHRYRASLQALVTITVGFAVNHLLKSWVARPRPSSQVLLHYAGWSFPSGHSALVMLTAGFLILLVHRSSWSRGWRALTITLLVLLIGLIGGSRVYVGAHFPTDVLGGWLLGYLVLIGIDHLFHPQA